MFKLLTRAIGYVVSANQLVGGEFKNCADSFCSKSERKILFFNVRKANIYSSHKILRIFSHLTEYFAHLNVRVKGQKYPPKRKILSINEWSETAGDCECIRVGVCSIPIHWSFFFFTAYVLTQIKTYTRTLTGIYYSHKGETFIELLKPSNWVLFQIN